MHSYILVFVVVVVWCVHVYVFFFLCVFIFVVVVRFGGNFVCLFVCLFLVTFFFFFFFFLYLSSFQLHVLLNYSMFYCKMYLMFYVNDGPEGKFLYKETIKLYCITAVIDPPPVYQNRPTQTKFTLVWLNRVCKLWSTFRFPSSVTVPCSWPIFLLRCLFFWFLFCFDNCDPAPHN